MRSLVALSLVGAVCGPAWARPDHDRAATSERVPPGAFRSEVQMRMPVDGRGDTATQPRESKPEPWMRAERPQGTVDRAPTSAPRADLPLKAEIAQKAHPGDHRDGNAAPQALDARAEAAKPADDRMGRPAEKPALPLKVDVVMKAQHGDQIEPTAQPGSGAAKSADQRAAPKGKPQHDAMTREQRQMLCQLAGVCFSAGAGSDDVEDKTK